MSRVRYDVTFTGRVQGVFFRATAEQVARDYNITGWVKNENDGSVRLVAEGEPAELDRFIVAVHSAKRDNIAEICKTESTATGEFETFRVRY